MSGFGAEYRARRAGEVEATLLFLAVEPECVLWCVSQARADEWVARGVPVGRIRVGCGNGSRVSFVSLGGAEQAGR